MKHCFFSLRCVVIVMRILWYLIIWRESDPQNFSARVLTLMSSKAFHYQFEASMGCYHPPKPSFIVIIVRTRLHELIALKNFDYSEAVLLNFHRHIAEYGAILRDVVCSCCSAVSCLSLIKVSVMKQSFCLLALCMKQLFPFAFLSKWLQSLLGHTVVVVAH